MMFEIVFYMILIHLLYDFHWQGQFIGTYKKDFRFILFIHSLTYAMILYVPLLFLWHFDIIVFTTLYISHYFIDAWKCSYDNDVKNFWTIYIDQFLHFIILCLIWIYIFIYI